MPDSGDPQHLSPEELGLEPNLEEFHQAILAFLEGQGRRHDPDELRQSLRDGFWAWHTGDPTQGIQIDDPAETLQIILSLIDGLGEDQDAFMEFLANNGYLEQWRIV